MVADGEAVARMLDRWPAQLPPRQPPCAACIAPMPPSRPGVETLSGPRTAMPPARKRSGVAASGAAPVAL